MQKVALPLIAVVILLLAGTAPASDAMYTCGNVDASEDGRVNLGDITFLISTIYLGGPSPEIPELANVDGSPDGRLNLTDITRLICMVYLDGCVAECPPCHQEIRGDCLPDTGLDSDSGFMLLEVINGALYIHHVNAQYQCCLEYVVSYEIVDNHITARQGDIGLPCDCICPFHLTSILYNLPSGEYVVELIGIYGNTIGVDTVQIVVGSGLLGYDFTGCKPMLRQSLGESIVYEYTGDTLSMHHYDAFYNCGAEIDGFMLSFQQAGDTLRFFEFNMMRMGMYCMCYYDLNATTAGIAPGEYILELWGQDGFWFGAAVELLDRRVMQLGP